MRKRIIPFLSIILAICFASSLMIYKTNSIDANKSQFLSNKTVVIDAGHGGKDGGTIGADGTNEKVINLEIAKALYDFLMVCGINSVLIRNGDYELYYNEKEKSRSDLYNRLDFVNSIPNSVLISIHQNHFEDEREWGTQIWYSANNPKSKEMADSIQVCVKELMHSDNNRQNKLSDSSYYILYKAMVPSVMVECGFMSNIKENKKLQDEEYQRDMAFSILCGVSNIV